MIRNTMLVAAVAVMAVPAMVSAQGVQTSSVTASATIDSYMNISGATNLAFGTVDRSTGATISATDGSVTRALSFNTDVTVSFPAVPAELVGSDPANKLAVSLKCAVDDGTGYGAAQDCTTSLELDLDVGTGLTSATLGFGGSISAAAAAAAVADTYSAQLDVRIDARS